MEAIKSFDLQLFQLINNLAGSMSWLNPVMIFFAEYAVFVLALFMIVLWVMKPTMRKALIAAFVAFVIAAILAKVAGMFFEHPQPFNHPDLQNVFKLIPKDDSNSFPSDHTALAFSVCVSLFIGSKSKFKFLYIVLAFLMGYSRIWVGVHFPLDVNVGALIGTIVALIVYPLVTKSGLADTLINIYQNIESKLLGSKGKHKSS